MRRVLQKHQYSTQQLLLCVGVVLTMISGLVRADPNATVMYWAKKVQDAAQAVSYVGTSVQTFGDQTLLSKVVHHAPSDTDVTESLFGEPLVSLRQGSQIRKYYPKQHLLLLTEQTNIGGFPALDAYVPHSAENYYKVAKVEKQYCLKMLCDVVTIEAKDQNRMSRRWWIDEKYGLLIKEQILSQTNNVLEEIAFTEISFDEAQAMAMLANNPLPSTGYIKRQISTSNVLQQEFSQSPQLRSGFTVISLLKRDGSQDGTFPIHENYSEYSWQWVLSDGLTTISVFVEIPNKSFHGVLRSNKGATQMLSVMRDAWMVTAIGATPFEVLQQIAEELPLR